MPTPNDVPLREPTATPLRAYGNNVTVACPCGALVIARSLGKPGGGAFECACGRWFKGSPEKGKRIDQVLVWEAGNDSAIASYRVSVSPHLHQAG